jgi:hypothetical protein
MGLERVPLLLQWQISTCGEVCSAHVISGKSTTMVGENWVCIACQRWLHSAKVHTDWLSAS